MNRFEWTNFISISFMTCFNLDLDQKLGIEILYLPFGDHSKAWIQSEIKNIVCLVAKIFVGVIIIKWAKQ